MQYLSIPIHGSEMHCRRAGSPDSPTILLVHGFPLQGAMWEPAASILKDQYHLIIPDLRGFGRSSLGEEFDRDDAVLAMGRHVDDLVALLHALKVEQAVHLVGLSMGGYIAFEFLRTHFDRIRSLGLIDTRAEGDAPDAKKGRYETASKVIEDGSAIVADSMLDKLFAEQTDRAIKSEWREIMTSTRPRTVAAALRGMAERPDSRQMLAQIDVPTLIVVGEGDAITPVRTAEEMAQGIPQARLEIVSDAGHMTPVEQPETFAKIVQSFLTQHGF